MWRKEYRIVYYSWEFDTLQSFYRDLLRLPQMYGWYTSPVDRGCKFKIGDNRLELICRHPTLPQGPAGMRLEAKDIELCYDNLKKEPRVTVIRPLQAHTWGEYSFCIKDPVGNWVEIYQRAEQYHPKGLDDGGGYFTDEYTAILFAEDLERSPHFTAIRCRCPWSLLGTADLRIGVVVFAPLAVLRTFAKRRGTHRRALR